MSPMPPFVFNALEDEKIPRHSREENGKKFHEKHLQNFNGKIL
jgi:hypothetical protein